MKKILSVIIALAVFLSVFSGLNITAIGAEVAVADTSETNIEFDWDMDYDKKVLTIYGNGMMTNFEKNKAPWCFRSRDIETVIIQEGITSIGDYAFWGCYYIKNIEIADSVISIGRDAFTDTAFYKNTDNWENGVLYIGNHLISADETLTGKYQVKEGTVSISMKAFNKCTELSEIIIPDGVKSIGKDAFKNTAFYNDKNNWEKDEQYEYSGLYIGKYLVAYNTGFKGTAIIRDGTELVADYMFDVFFNSYYGSIKGVRIPASVKYIGRDAFLHASELENVYLEDLEAWCNTYFYDCYTSNPFWEAGKLYLNGKLLDNLVIPESVTSIESCLFRGCKSISNVTLHDKITSIGDYAFSECSMLTSVTIPESVISIGERAFLQCSNLKSLKISDGVRYIGESAFRSCGNLADITIGKDIISIGDDAFFDCYFVKKVSISDLASWCGVDFVNYYSNPIIYSENLYINDQLLTELVIPDNVTEISKYAFYRLNSITKLTVGENVESIGDYAFEGCTSLKTIVFSESIRKTGRDAFYGCDSLQDVCVKNLDEWCEINFTNCYSTPLFYAENFYVNDNLIQQLTVSENVKTLGDFAFCGYSSLTAVKISDGVESIGKSAFYGCENLIDISISDSVSSIGVMAFDETAYSKDSSNRIKGVLYIDNYLIKCIDLLTDKYEIKNNTKLIADNAFYECSELKRIIIPDCVVGVGKYSFYQCENLAEIDFENGIKYIGDYAFYKCQQLKNFDIVIPDSTEEIGDYAFYYINLKGLYLGKNLKHIGDGAFCYSLQIKNFVIPDSVETIGEKAFSEWKYMETLVLGKNLKTIGKGAFRYNNITNLFIPDSVNTIDDDAFKGCSYLTNVVVPHNVKKVGSGAFYYCNALKKITFKNPECEFGVNYVVPKNTKIYGYGGSTAQEYAEKNNIEFDLIQEDCEHSWNDGETVRINCLEVATVIYICQICGERKNDFLPEKEHNFEEGKVNLKASCISDGEKIYLCRDCNYVKTENIPSTGHKEVTLVSTIPTCTETGSVGGKRCFVCKEITQAPEILQPLDHTITLVDKKSPTYFEKGYTGDEVCEKCGKFISVGKFTAKLKLKTPKVTVKGNKKKIRISYVKVKDADGFQVKCIKGKKVITRYFKTKKSVTKSIGNLKKGKYKVKIRAFVMKDGMKAYSNFTKLKTVTVK